MGTALYTGTSGWAYPTWKPSFYPEKLPSRSFLPYYAGRLRAVEVNYTFRRLPQKSTLESWIAQTPEQFRFCLKAHQRITHFARLRTPSDFLDAFLRSLEPLREAHKLGPVLFQLPPDFSFDEPRLAAFLSALPEDLLEAFEFRHPSWFCDRTYTMLRERGAALCVAQTAELETPDVQTARFRYYRFRKPDYSEAEVDEIGRRLRDAGGEVYAFFKHEEGPEGALNAEHLIQVAA